ncbi:helix-turn-helix transcriptional regulator [Microbacterium testaceum]|uniref:helix-turn-helix transcriptional regulator n=1 Tax=Microbacterium testaceum TaxID=2033 RepID=UPI001786544E|nr:helix-turn-helix transcriptional regulator [Microbacterium testaceum]
MSKGLIGSDRDAGTLAERARGGASLVIAGPRGSGRSYLLRTIAAELDRHGALAGEIRTSSTLSDVPFGGLDAAGLSSLRGPAGADEVNGVIVVDDVDVLDVKSMRALSRGIAAGRVRAVIGLRTARPRSIDRPDDMAIVRRAILDLWLDGFAERIDLSELNGDDALAMMDLFPDAELLDSATRAGLVWRADGSRALLRHLVLSATSSARSGLDPLAAVRTVAPHSGLAVALERHVSDFPREDLECLAGIRRLPHLETAVATRLFDGDSVQALLATGLLHADASAERLLTANDLVGYEAQRRLGPDVVDALVEAAGSRMLAEADEWWSATIAVTISERWHRLGVDASGESAYSPALRGRVALDAAREANDRGDSGHAAAHAARGLRAVDDPALRAEARIAGGEDALLLGLDVDTTDAAARRRLARSHADAQAGCVTDGAPPTAQVDARIDHLLAASARAGGAMDWAEAADIAVEAVAETSASPAMHLRALVAAGVAETFRGGWSRGRHHFQAVERVLDARQRPEGIGVRERIAAIMSMLAGYQIAGADGQAVRRRLECELSTTAREGGAAALTIAGAAASIAYAGAGRPAESRRELATALLREPSAVTGMDASMIELGVAEELAMAGSTAEAREILRRFDSDVVPLVARSKLYVETTVLAAEGRLDEARQTARLTAQLSAGTTAVALRIRDLFRLVTLGEACAREIDELIQLAATSDLPLAAVAVRRAAGQSLEEQDVPVDELRLHALWSSAEDAEPGAGTPRAVAAPPSPEGVSEDLTPREREIALLANEGLTNREIAARLYLSIRTVESHVYQARMKTGTASRKELARLVAAQGPRALTVSRRA